MNSWMDLGWWEPAPGKALSEDAHLRALLGNNVVPHWNKVYRAFELTRFEDVRVVIVGQDPYPTPGQAMGLAFSVPNGFLTRARPRSLVNILAELKSDLGIETPENLSDLTPWARQGVLLLNTAFTTEPGVIGAHMNVGWYRLTARALRAVAAHREKVVFVLWGSRAERTFQLSMEDDFGFWRRKNGHLVIRSAHPSPRSALRGFHGSKPFSKINDWLDKPIDWDLARGQGAAAAPQLSKEVT
jgi:uracil-DNA glycosylase